MAKDRSTTLTAALSVALAAAPVAAAEPASDEAKVAAIPIAGPSTLGKPMRHQLADGVVEGLRRGPFEVLSPAEVYAAYPDSVEACESLACYAEVKRFTGADYTVRTEVDVNRKDYHFTLQIYDVEHERVVATVEDTCEVCGGQEAARLVADLAAKLAQNIVQSQAPAVLELSSTPPGATVFVDDVEVGATPMELEVVSGAHRVRVEKQGFASQTRDLDLVGGVRESHSVTLRELVDTAERPIPAWPGWTLVGTGAAGVVAGIALIAVDEQPIESRCTGENIDEFGNCRFRQNTLPLGLAVTIGGLVLAAAGTTLLIVRQNRGRASKQARLRPTLRGLAIRF